ncbi:MAG: precorrin-6Y C5,15-methyltransferase (decarboxylating) subunit CbiT [Bacillota bacterium]|nr:precorrin-6Y C5,15-methyltransferase (decarboxylating) subunit CbiT [Bacillota bacterium]
MNDFQNMVVPGLPDELFNRGNAPLTKEEIRCLTLSKLRLTAESRVLDIGAGSGGLTVECARLLKRGQVWAVERDPEALELVKANCRRFAIDNVTIIEGEAPVALEGIERLDRVVIGGSGGKMGAIIARAAELLLPAGIIVINCILMESLFAALQCLKEEGFQDIQYIQVAVNRAKAMGGGTALQPINPVFITSASKGAA